MSQICINVPTFQAQHTIGLEVTLDGAKHVMNYRVESIEWPEHLPPEERIDLLRTYIRDYDKAWELVNIGPAGGGLIPMTFKQRVLEMA
ncbi:MAG: hypothetical protein ACE5G0_03425 [Rhodothermales bacterium]